MSKLNEMVAREVMGWPVVESANLIFDKPEVCCLVQKNGILKGTPCRVGLGVDKWTHSWTQWKPDESIAQAFKVIDEVLSWDWHDDAWFEMSVGAGDPIVEFRRGIESLALHLGVGTSLAHTICVVALEAARERDGWE